MSCPKENLCFYNKSIMFTVLLLLLCIGYVYYYTNLELSNLRDIIAYQQNDNIIVTQNELPDDDIMDKLLPPSRVYHSKYIPKKSNEINISTRGEPEPYQQIGILINETSNLMLPLFGQPKYPGSQHWLYYTQSDKFQSVKLPIEQNGKDCQADLGCKEVQTDDTLNVPGYTQIFNVRLYENQKMRYLPHVL